MYPRERSFWRYKVYSDIRGDSLESEMRVGSLKKAIFATFEKGRGKGERNGKGEDMRKGEMTT